MRDPGLTRRQLLARGGRTLGATLALGSPLLLEACGSSSAHGAGSSSKGDTLAFAYQPGYDYGLYYVANQMRFFGDTRLQPMTIFQEGTAEVDGLLGGKFAAAAVGFTPVLTLASKGQSIKVIDVVANGARNYTLVAQSDVTSVADLKGKTVGITLGTNYEYFLDQVLAKFGVAQSDLHVMNLQPPAAQAAFVAGRIDATVPVTVNNQTILSQRHGAHALFTAADFTKPPNPSATPFAIYDLLVATSAGAEANAKRLQAVSRGLHDQVTSLVSHRRAKAVQAIYDWQRNVVKAQVTRGEIEQGLDGYDFYTTAQAHELLSGGKLASFLHSVGTYMKSKSLISSVPDTTKLIDARIVPV